MAGSGLLIAGVAAAITAIIVLRLSWGRKGRSVFLNVIGWLLLAGGIATGCVFARAWGAAVVTLWAMGAALAALAAAAWRSTPARRKASNRRAGMLPEKGQPTRVGGRIGTFMMTTLAAMVSSVALAVASRGLFLLAGASEADANVIALFAVPLVWAVLAFIVLMTGSRRRQVAILAAPIALALPALAKGGII